MAEGFFFFKKPIIKTKQFWIGCSAIFLFVLIIPTLFSFHAHEVFSSRVRLSNDHLHVTPLMYFLTQWRVLLKYFQIIVIPIGQSLDHAVYLSQTLWDLPTLGAGFIVFCVFMLGILMFKKNRMISFGIFWIFLTAAVECSFVPIRHVIFEHRMYLPMVGVSLAVSAWLYQRGLRKKDVVLSVVLLTVLAGVTVKRNCVWKDGVTLWSDVVHKAPMESRGYDNLGAAYLEEGNYDQALKNFFMAQSLDPTNKEMYNNIGLVYLEKKAWVLALKNFYRAVEIDPEFATGYNNIGLAKESLGDEDAAMESFVKAVEYGPNLLEPRLNIARIAERKKNFGLALDMCLMNEDAAPNNLENLRQMVRLASLEKRQDIKSMALTRILAMPQSPQEILITALSFVQSGLVREGLAVFKKGMADFPREARLYIEAGKVFGNYEDFDQAIAVWREGMKMAPKQTKIFSTLIDQAQNLKRNFKKN